MFTFFMGEGLSPEAQQYLYRSNVAGVARSAIVTLIDGLVADGIWTKLDVLAVAQDNEIDSLLNLKSTSYTQVANGSPSFVTNRGFTLGVGKYIDTVVVPNAGGNCVTNSNHLFAYERTASVNDYIFGASSGVPQWGAYRTAGDVQAYSQAAGNIAQSSGSTGRFTGVSRVSSTALYGLSDGISASNTTLTVPASPAYSAHISGLNVSGVHTDGYAGSIGAWGVGGGLDATELGNLRTRIDTYMTAIGASV